MDAYDQNNEEIEVIDVDELSQVLRKDDCQGYLEEKNEDFSLRDYDNPFENMLNWGSLANGNVHFMNLS